MRLAARRRRILQPSLVLFHYFGGFAVVRSGMRSLLLEQKHGTSSSPLLDINGGGCGRSFLPQQLALRPSLLDCRLVT